MALHQGLGWFGAMLRKKESPFTIFSGLCPTNKCRHEEQAVEDPELLKAVSSVLHT
jgi:hypothetical protein